MSSVLAQLAPVGLGILAYFGLSSTGIWAHALGALAALFMFAAAGLWAILLRPYFWSYPRAIRAPHRTHRC
jgi:membrane protein YdbS with pleckstrin-like domain